MVATAIVIVIVTVTVEVEAATVVVVAAMVVVVAAMVVVVAAMVVVVAAMVVVVAAVAALVVTLGIVSAQNSGRRRRASPSPSGCGRAGLIATRRLPPCPRSSDRSPSTCFGAGCPGFAS